MKKTVIFLVLVLLVSFVFANGVNSNVNAQVSTNSNPNPNVGQNIQAQVQERVQTQIKTGLYNSNGNRFEIRTQKNVENREQLQLQVGNVSALVLGNLTQKKEGNQTRLMFKMSNGKNAEVKVMPNVASENALEQLRLRVCSEDNNCTIELKDVGQGNQTRVAYEVQAEKQYRVFGLFRARAMVNSNIDVETGEIIETKTPWWAAISSEVSE